MLTTNGWTFGVLAVLAFVAGVVLGFVELIVVAFALVLCLVFAVVWLAFRPRVEVHRAVVPNRVHEGDGAAGVLTITNVGSRRCPPTRAVERFAGRSISIEIPALAPGATKTISYLLPANRRGCFAVGPLHLTHGDPLRLVSAGQVHGGQATLWVHPRVERIPPVPTGRTQDMDGPTSAGAPRGGVAFHSLREYVPGDDPRLIHWRSSARLDTLMVRHTVVTNEPKILIVLDTSAEPYTEESFDDAVRAVASLVAACVDHRFPTDLRTTGGVSGSIDPTGLGLTDVMDKLAGVSTSSGDPGLEHLRAVAARREQGVSMCVVTGQPSIEQAKTIGQVRGRYDMTTFVQLGEKFGRPPMNVPGVMGVNGATLAEFARSWRSKVR